MIHSALFNDGIPLEVFLLGKKPSGSQTRVDLRSTAHQAGTYTSGLSGHSNTDVL